MHVTYIPTALKRQANSLLRAAKAYSEPGQKSKMNLSAKLVNG